MLFVEPLRSPARTRQPGSCCRDLEFAQLQEHYIILTRQEAVKLFQALGTVCARSIRNGPNSVQRSRPAPRPHLCTLEIDFSEAFYIRCTARVLQICLL